MIFPHVHHGVVSTEAPCIFDFIPVPALATCGDQVSDDGVEVPIKVCGVWIIS